MQKMLGVMDRLLALLPFNGDKTAIGAGMQILLPILVAKFPIILMAEPAMDALSLTLTGIGLFHKAIKGMRRK